MKPLAVLFLALLLTGVLGCDGDGDGATGSTEPTDVPDTGPEPIVVDRESTIVIWHSASIGLRPTRAELYVALSLVEI